MILGPWLVRRGRLLLMALAIGCAAGDGPNVCDADKYQCESGTDGWKREPRCRVDGALDVLLGQGQQTFDALPAAALPEVYHGAQGGMHVFLGLRVLNPALEEYDNLKVRFELVYRRQDGPCAGGALGTGGDECDLEMAARELVLGRKHPLRVVDGVVEEYGLLVLLDARPAGVWRVGVTVEDPCGRVGSDVRTVFVEDE